MQYQYFSDGHRVIRIQVAPDVPMNSETFFAAPAEAFQFRSGVWAPRPDLASQVAFTGEWTRVHEDEVELILKRSGATIHSMT